MIGKFIAPAGGGGTPNPKGIYIGGAFNRAVHNTGSYNFNNLMLLNSDLSYEATTISPSFIVSESVTAAITSIVQQPDGKILVAGAFFAYQNVVANRIVRINPDFTIDASFNTTVGAGQAVMCIALQSDGKVLIGGFFQTYNSTPLNRIARLNSDGSLDTSFNIGTGFNEVVRDIKVQPDGKILAVGNFTSYNSVTANRIIRLNSNGTIDSSFNSGTGFNLAPLKMALQNDGKIIVVGGFTSYNGTTANAASRRLRLNTNGSIDTFASSDSPTGTINDVSILSNGDVLVVGLILNAGQSIRKYSSSGVVDATFGTNSIIGTLSPSNFQVLSMDLTSDEKIVLTGSFSAYNGRYTAYTVLLNSDGTVNRTTPFQMSFNGGVSSKMNFAKVLSNGKIMIGGERMYIFNSNNLVFCGNSVRLTDYKTLNLNDRPSSDIVSTFTENVVPKITVSRSGDRYLSGVDSSNLGNFIRKLDLYGGIIENYNGGASVVNSGVFDTLILEDNSIIMIGDFTSFRGVNINRIVKTNVNDVVDQAFVTAVGTGFTSSAPRCIVPTNDNKFYVGGNFSVFNGLSRSGIIKFNADGTRDTSFNNATFISFTNPGVNHVGVLPDGKIIIIGVFTSYGGVTRNGIARLNADGTNDASFNTGGTGFGTTSSTNYPYKLIVQSDGKIVVVGSFSSYNGNAVGRIVRLNADGTIDNTFNSGIGFTGATISVVARDIKQLSDGNIIVVGDFRSYNYNNAGFYCAMDSNGNFLESNIHFNSTASSIFIRD